MSAPAPADRVRASFVEQAEACESLGSPFTGRLLRLLSGARARSGDDAGLAAAYATPPDSDAALLAPVLAALHRHEAFLLHWLNSAPQTNAVRRSAALIAAGH